MTKKEILEESIGENSDYYKVIAPNIIIDITDKTTYLILKNDEIIEHIYLQYLLNAANSNDIQENICNLFGIDSLLLVSIMGRNLFIKHIRELFKNYGIEAIQRSFLLNGSYNRLLFAKNSWYYRGHQIFQLR